MDRFIEVLIFLPTFGALIGYVCKWVAIRMLFAPSKFVGVGPIGWQGVVQRQAPKFANGVADTVEQAGVAVEALLAKVDTQMVVEKFGPALDAEAMGLLETVVEAAKPGGWAEFAPAAREQMAGQLSSEGRRVGKVVLDELRPAIARSVDVRHLVVKQLSGENADTLAVLFQRIARNELRVVILYGAVLGFFIGLLEVGVWELIEKWWLLPLVGAIDGLVNNWLAIQMIFRPYEKTYYFGIFPFQGLFPARQEEIAKEYGEMIAHDVLAPRAVFDSIWASHGKELGEKALAIVERELSGMLALLPMMLGVQLDDALKKKIMEALAAKLPALAARHEGEVASFVRDSLGIEETLDGMLKVMPKHEFEKVLRGIFQEDEKTLVVLGGVLGGVIGLMQAAIVLAVS